MQKIIEGVNLWGMDFGYGDYEGVLFKDCYFSHTKFGNDQELKDCTFEKCRFEDARLLCKLINTNFISCSFVYSYFSECTDVLFKSCNFEKCCFNRAKLAKVTFEDVAFYEDIDEYNIYNTFRNAALNNCEFKNTDLDGCKFEGAHLTNCVFTGEIDIGTGDFNGAIFDNVTVPDDAIEKLSNQRIYSKVEFWSPAQNGKEV